MWQTKYASAVPKNLGVGVNFLPGSEGYFLWASVVCGLSSSDLGKTRSNLELYATVKPDVTDI